MNCKSEKPYPEIKVEKKNREYAKLLLEDYAGYRSEDMAIHLYLYQSFILNERTKELAETLKNISKVEMHHLDMLGETIKLLGLNPVYASISEDDFQIPWTSATVDYTTDLKNMLSFDIERERSAIDIYERHKNLIDDKYIKNIIDRIIEDEKIHLAIFNYYYQKIFYAQ